MEGRNKKMELLGNAPIPKALLAMGLPTMIGMMINALYNLVDAYFVGGLGTSQMGAISVNRRAAQPVSIRRASGASRRRRKTALRASLSPLAVMAQLLTQMTSASAGLEHSTPPRPCHASRRDCVSY